MAPWVIAGLLSWEMGLAVLSVVACSTGVLFFLARSSFYEFGFRRLICGYLGGVVAMLLMALLWPLFGSSTGQELLVLFILLSYIACLALALIIVPTTFFILIRYKLLVMPWVVLVSMMSSGVFVFALYTPSASDLLYVTPVLGMAGLGFSIGARIPWSTQNS